MVRTVLKGVGVVVGAVVLTTFTIDATDSFSTSQTALSILARNATEETCPSGTTLLTLASGEVCMDIYENSPSLDCPHQRLQSLVATEENLAAAACTAESKPDAAPWVFATYHQAKALCAQRGMQLPSQYEWYEASIGTREGGCNIDGSLKLTGASRDCMSSFGIADAIGNVWEWVEGEVSEGVYNGRPYPDEGYVTDVDTAGVPTVTGDNPSTLYGNDYAWSATEGTFAMMRGGYFGSGEDAGIFAVHANIAPSFASAATGFRCVKRR